MGGRNMSMGEELIRKAAVDLLSAREVVALTGAGISVESGIPAFRGENGIWSKLDPLEYAHIDAFCKNPAKVWNVLFKAMKEMIENAGPNDAHMGLVRLEQLNILQTIITQNVDGLHQKAGSTDVIELHGTFAWYRCTACRKRKAARDIDASVIPPRCECGGIFRPDCVLFGESIPDGYLWRSKLVASQCDLMLVIGTSARVHPAALMPVIAMKNGAKVIEINSEKTPLTEQISDYILRGRAGQIMNRIIAELEKML